MKFEDDFDGLLNDALREVREAEPRMGLEGRVLAGVRAGAEEWRFAWWKWASVAAAVVVIVLVVAVRRGSKVDVVRKAPVVVVPSERVESAKGSSKSSKDTNQVRAVAVKPPRKRAAEKNVVAAVEKKPFPTPAPLNEQEKALMLLARNNPGVLRSVGEERNTDSIAIPKIEIKEIGETR